MSDTFTPDASNGVPADGVSSDADATTLATAAPDAESAPAETPADQPGADTDAHKARGVQKRLDELTALRRQAERERDEWRAMAMRTAQGGQPQQPQQPSHQAPQHDPLAAQIAQHVGPAPKPEDFPAGEFDPGFRQAEQQWLLRNAETRAEVRMMQRLQMAQASAVQQQAQHALEQQITEVEKTDPQARDAVGSLGERLAQLGNGGNWLADTIAKAGIDVAYHIATNPEVEARIRQARSPEAALFELGEIRAAVKARRASPSVQPTSAPPPPPRGIRGGGSASLDHDRMPMSQYAALMAKELSHRG